MNISRKRTAIYTRVSTEDQANEGFSLDAQLDQLRSYCQACDLIIAGEYVDDGYSGRNIKRPAYERMFNEINNWDIVLVIKMDRIHRNSQNFMQMMDVLKKHQKEFISMTESLDTSTAMGRFVMDIIQRIAQLESEQIGERVYAGMEQKARTKKGMLGFNIPYGYDYHDGTLLVNEKEKKVVKQIFSWYLSGSSFEEISKMLNNNKTPTKRGGFWAKKTISTILKNPTYCGYIHWEDFLYKGSHQPIISEYEFNETQKIIASKYGKPSKKINFL